MMRKKGLILFISIQVFIIKSVVGQTFEKKIDSSFNGCLTFGTEIANSYYFIGSSVINSQSTLYGFKTDASGNLQKKKNICTLLSNNVVCVQDNFNNIIVADGNRLIKINSNFELLWIKSYSNITTIKKIKSSNTSKYLFSSNNKIFQADSSGNILPDTINYNFILSDFSMVNDTIYLLQKDQSKSKPKQEIILMKYDKTGNLITQKTVSEYLGYDPILFEIMNNENKILIFTDVSYLKRSTLSVLQFDKNFNVGTSSNVTFPNLWIDLCIYSNNSFIMSGDYDGNGKPYDNKLIQMDNNLQIKTDHADNSGINQYMFISKDGYIIILYCSAFVKKIEGQKLTFISNNKNNKLDFHPNPFNEFSVIKFETAKNITLNVYDALGKVVYTNKYYDTNEVELTKTDLPIHGIYFYQINADNKIYIGKLASE